MKAASESRQALEQRLRALLPDLADLPASARDLAVRLQAKGVDPKVTVDVVAQFEQVRLSSIANAIQSTGDAGSANRLKTLAGRPPAAGAEAGHHPSLVQRLLKKAGGSSTAAPGDSIDALIGALSRGDKLIGRILGKGPAGLPTGKSSSVKPLPHLRPITWSIPKPADWGRRMALPEVLQTSPEAAVHVRFVERNAFQNFTTSKLSELEQDLRAALARTPAGPERDVLRFEIANVLVQNKPTFTTLREARALLDSVVADSGSLDSLPGTFAAGAHEVSTMVNEMLLEPDQSIPVKQVNMSISNRCPLVCQGCYHFFPEEPMKLDDALKSIDKLRAQGTQELILTGGDPLMSPNLLPIVNYAHEHGIKVAIDTVGYSLTPELAQQLAGKVAFVGLPVDGGDQETTAAFRKGKGDLFEKTLEAIDILNAAGIRVKINTTVTQANVDKLEDVAKIVRKVDNLHGWSVFQWWDTRAGGDLFARHAVVDGRYEKATASLQERHADLALRVGSVESRTRVYFEVLDNGDVHNYGPTAHTGIMIMGNLKEQSAEEITRSPAFAKTDNPKTRTWFP